ncbi:MAG TPA: serine protease [Puia sp.]|nr:serine protease [Puia sp.]
MQDATLLDAVERYLRGEMLPEEQLFFEHVRKTNPEVDQMVVEHASFLNKLTRFGETRQLKTQLSDVYQQLSREGTIDQPTTTAKVITLWKKYKRTVFVAASIAGITALFISGLISLITPKVSQSRIDQLSRQLNAQAHQLNTVTNTLNSAVAARNTTFTRGGTGFLVDGRGYLLTNAHVVKNATVVEVQNTLGEYQARIIQLDRQADLALLKIEDTSYHAFSGLPYGISRTGSELGEDLFTLGYPRPEIVYGKGYMSAETGIQGDTTAFQLTVAANPGNSGSPVLNNEGEVIGMVTSSQQNAEGMVFAVRSKNIVNALDSMRSDSSLQKTDSTLGTLRIPTNSVLRGMDRKTQIKRLRDYIFIVKSN